MGANLTDTYEAVIGQLEAAGLNVVTDSRNANPPCVIVDPPTISRGQSRTLVELTFPVYVVVPPPGNRDAVNALLTIVDDVVGAVNVVAGNPSTYQLGPADCPAFECSVIIQIQRT
jgi:hypothetical protein